MGVKVAFDKTARVGDCVAYPVFTGGQKTMKRIKIEEIHEGEIVGYDLDDHLHRQKRITNLSMVVLNADE